MLPFASTLTTMALYHSSLRWFALPSCKAKAVGLPPSLIQLAFEILRLQNFLGTRPFYLMVGENNRGTSPIVHALLFMNILQEAAQRMMPKLLMNKLMLWSPHNLNSLPRSSVVMKTESVGLLAI